MANRRAFLIAAVAAITALPFCFTGLKAADKHEHAHGPNGGDLLEVEDKEHHHIEIKHDEKSGTLTIWILAKDGKTAVALKEAPKLNLKSKKGNKQLEMKGEGAKWEATDELLKDEPEGRIQIVLNDKKHNVKIEHHHH